MELSKTEELIINLMRQGADIEMYLPNVDTDEQAKEQLQPVGDLLNRRVRHIRTNSEIVGAGYWRVDGPSDNSYLSVSAFLKRQSE